MALSETGCLLNQNRQHSVLHVTDHEGGWTATSESSHKQTAHNAESQGSSPQSQANDCRVGSHGESRKDAVMDMRMQWMFALSFIILNVDCANQMQYDLATSPLIGHGADH